jgi:hypothetical protein
MSASKEAIEAAAIAMFYQQAGLKPPYPLWEDADSDEKDNCLNDAELALTSAAPAIQAAALRDAADALEGGWAYGAELKPDGNEDRAIAAAIQMTHENAEQLRARADRLEAEMK